MMRLAKVWYVAYGSNLARRRFMCYINGGRVNCNRRRHPGCRDRCAPCDHEVIEIPFRLYFAEAAGMWGHGGAAFLSPAKDATAFARCYLITLEQLRDVILQENGEEPATSEINLDLEPITREPFGSLHHVKHRSSSSQLVYGRIVNLGSLRGIPALTFTSALDIGRSHLLAPSEVYLATIIEGLHEAYPEHSPQAISTYLVSAEGIRGHISVAAIRSLAERCFGQDERVQ